jgi:heterotetrameric sarcosine oxidase gamma subunit
MAERILERDLSARTFDPDAAAGRLPARSRTVVVGAGIVGSSVAYHLADLGEEVLVLERGSVASGTSWHAAGLVVRARSTHALTELAAVAIELYPRLGVETGIDVNLVQCGSLTVARTDGRMDELRYAAAVARHHGIPAHILPPSAIAELWPLAVADGVTGALHQPLDGHVNPGLTALALATAAHRRGAVFREGVSVLGIDRIDGRVAGVNTTAGLVECERVVLACGLWTRDVAEACGAAVPLWPAAHVHVQTDPIGGATIDLPVLRDLDGSFYVRHVNGRLMVGAFEPDGQPLDPRGLPADFAFGEFEPDWPHFEAVQRSAEERIPALRGVGWSRFLNAPESFTPDANFCLGETAEVDGLFVAAGFNSQGIIYAAGAGKALAEWMQHGSATFDAAAVDVQRFARQQSNRHYLHARTREGLGRLYAMHWPFVQPVTARGVRRTQLHDRVAAAGACFGELNGFERANWYAPPGVEPAYEYSYGRQNWFEHSAAEHRATREAVALFDLSGFAKVTVSGPDALRVVQRLCTQELDVAVGRAVYTLMLNSAGGIELDGTVTRLSADRFLVVTPTSALTKTMAMFRRGARGRNAHIADVTAAHATIGVMGPNSRELLSRISNADLSNDAFPWGTAREIEVGDGHALCIRIGFVGELGYELYPTSDVAVNVYDSILAANTAGEPLGLRHAGYHALDSLRMEKGYRHLGHDIGNLDSPYEAALGFTVALDKPGGFVGRDALFDRSGALPVGPGAGAGAERRQVYVKLLDPEPLLFHDESILVGGRIVGQITSGAYGHTLGAACGLGYVPSSTMLAAVVDAEVDCAGERVPALLSTTAFYDPRSVRLRS